MTSFVRSARTLRSSFLLAALSVSSTGCGGCAGDAPAPSSMTSTTSAPATVTTDMVNAKRNAVLRPGVMAFLRDASIPDDAGAVKPRPTE
ncbi:MAG: hypothetical protein U0169_24975 [Polyangiaceae bacterium]